MKKKGILVTAILAMSILVVSCKDQKKEEVSSEPTTEVNASENTSFEGQDGHNAQNSLDWAGEYTGTIPCADCPGIDVTIALHEDGSFTKKNVYQEKSDATFEEKGTFTWDQSGSIVTLNSGDDSSLFQVQEGRLLMLDQEGQKITGDLANMYVLIKL